MRADMPAPEQLVRLVVKFRRRGYEIDSEEASIGERPPGLAHMLVRLDDFQAGDALLCMADSVDSAPLSPARPKHG
jgi:hypothetical protein